MRMCASDCAWAPLCVHMIEKMRERESERERGAGGGGGGGGCIHNRPHPFRRGVYM